MRCPHDRLNNWFAAKIRDYTALAAEVLEAVQQYISSIEGTDTAVKELTMRENDYSKHQQALLESDEEPSDGADTAVLKSAGSLVCIKHKKGKHSSHKQRQAGTMTIHIGQEVVLPIG